MGKDSRVDSINESEGYPGPNPVTPCRKTWALGVGNAQQKTEAQAPPGPGGHWDLESTCHRLFFLGLGSLAEAGGGQFSHLLCNWIQRCDLISTFCSSRLTCLWDTDDSRVFSDKYLCAMVPPAS